MNNLFTSIVSLYKKYATPVKGIYRKKGMRPGMDWLLVIGFLFFCGVCAMGVHAFLYIGVKNNSWWKSNTGTELPQVNINQTLLDDVLKRFDDKENRLKNVGESNTPDPSL